jgi:sigma-70-like protein
MDEVYEYCVRMLGAGAVAIHASHEAFVAGGSDRIERMAGAVQACRSHAGQGGPGIAVEGEISGGGETTLADSVAREIADATAKLPSDQREALALRDLVGLSHGEIARALGIDADAVGMLVARARLALRAKRRGIDEEPDDACTARQRALLLMVRRQDSVGVSTEGEDWVFEHLGSCESCSRVHAAMLEASVCYRAWRTPDPGLTRPGARGRGGAGERKDAVGDAVP